MKGIVWTGQLEIRDDVEVRDPGPGEVRVRIANAGLCHSDVSVIDGTIPFPTPVVLGHEGAGVVEQVGAAVTKVKVGDHVVLTTVANCGRCAACDRGQPTHCRDSMGRLPKPFTVGGEPAFTFANAGVFTEAVVVTETQAIAIDPEVSLEVACLIGCGVLTGAGAVFNRAKVQQGQSVVVIGAGGIGQSAIQAARIAGASKIVVLDANPEKEAVSRRFGATDFLDVRSVEDGGLVKAVKELGLPTGADHVIECVGRPELIRTSVSLLDWGGTATLLGVPKLGTEASFVVNELYNDKSILGCRYGSARPHHDIPLLVQLYQDGRLLLDEMVSQIYPLDQINQALDDLHHGKLNRGVLAVSGS
ncbi:MAG TPA: Zn-dependent alcohol dehydrogenase [Acidimicrobiales bacterium]|jgi:S-(hydroxymethyl)glutathione dehydrogenase/alcohol dehydrogenase